MTTLETILSKGLITIAVLVILVNIITEVCKSTFGWLEGSKRINLFALIVSIVLTLATGLAYYQINALALTWYAVIAFIIAGFMVAFAAMFGFDKLLKYIEEIREKV